MILIDFNQIALSSIFDSANELNQLQDDEDSTLRLVRHVVLNTLKHYRKTYSYDYGEMVIACDSKTYWRRDMFPFYKANRSKERDQDKYNWKLIFKCLDAIRNDLIEFFPYKVLLIDNLEADDIIAVLAKVAKESVLIVSRDHDYNQLYKYTHVKQYNPLQKKILNISNPKEVLIEHIVKGDRKDGVPGILGDDDVFININKRQGRLTQKKLDNFLKNGYNGCENDYQRDNWKRNERLVDFDFIPQEIEEDIIDKYNTLVIKGNRGKMFDYLVNNRCNILLNTLEDF